MKFLGALLVLVGVGVFGWVVVDDVMLRWWEHPEATNRLLWMQHTGRCFLHVVGFVAGLALMFFGGVIVSEES